MTNTLPSGEFPKLREMCGLSSHHLDIFKAVNLEYPPKLREWALDIQHICSLINPSAAETFIYAEACDPWPEKRMTMQFADVNPSLQQHLGNKTDTAIFRESIPTLTCKAIIVARMQLENGDKIWRLCFGSHISHAVC